MRFTYFHLRGLHARSLRSRLNYLYTNAFKIEELKLTMQECRNIFCEPPLNLRIVEKSIELLGTLHTEPFPGRYFYKIEQNIDNDTKPIFRDRLFHSAISKVTEEFTSICAVSNRRTPNDSNDKFLLGCNVQILIRSLTIKYQQLFPIQSITPSWIIVAFFHQCS